MGMLCYSLKRVSSYYCEFMAATRAGAAVEIRLDRCDFSEEEVREIFSHGRQALLIATCHAELPSQVDEAVKLLSAAILAGADYVDIPLDFPEGTRRWLVNLAMNRGCRVILSYHNDRATDTLERLVSIAEQARQEGADIIKIVTTAETAADADTVFRLYDRFEPGRLLAFAMGPAGRESRFRALEKGAPFLFVSPTRDGTTAPGQPCWFDLLPEPEIALRGEADVPASKSFAQRAILLAALASGTTRFYGVTLCDDVEAAMGVARSLYADVRLDGTTLTVTGHQDILRDGLKVRDNTLFVGESGLLARLCIPLAGLSGEEILITGEKTLLRRRIDDHRTALRKLGLRPVFTDRSHLPVCVRGKLRSGAVSVAGDKGSQMISGLLLALSQCDRESTLLIDGVTSEPYINLTTHIAGFFGLTGYDCPELADEDAEDDPVRTWFIDPSQRVTPVTGLQVERDWSAAAMLLVAGAIAGDISIRGLDTESKQADAVIFNLLHYNRVDIRQDRESGTISVRRSIIAPFYYDITDSPDLFAPLFVLACFAEGESIIAGLKRLKNKESDRAATFVQEFLKLGVKTSVTGDKLSIHGRENRVLPPAACSAHGDHRLAMALSVAALRASGPVEIDDVSCIAKSFPGFLETLEKLKRN